uniref:DUF4216 domain-containing protein n=1 Tax=Cajanus cajan TaxID=3821 RepID=A0A151SX15_CAJCA|nr:hypothetical protein KK1_014770 [Cajanus cajan]
MLLELLNDALLEENTLPKSFYDTKKIISGLGLGYEKIHACPNDCILYKNDLANDEKCPKCNFSRWKNNSNDDEARKKNTCKDSLFLLTLKSFVHNRAHPEGSIAKGYLAHECLLFCSRYLSRIETTFNRPRRNDDGIDSFFMENTSLVHKGRPLGIKSKVDLQQSSTLVTEDIKLLSRGPLQMARRYSGYIVNGVRFHTKKRERCLKSQNNGIVVTVKTRSYASSRDKHPKEGEINYYGGLTYIIQLDYLGIYKVILFKCDWVDINRGCKTDNFGMTLVNFKCLQHSGDDICDDPFIFASQAKKVFYVENERQSDWLVIVHAKARDIYDLGDEWSNEIEQRKEHDLQEINHNDLIRAEVNDNDDGIMEFIINMEDALQNANVEEEIEGWGEDFFYFFSSNI